MQYTVWSRGRQIGETALGFRRFDARARSGIFVPNAEGERVLPVVSAVPAAIHAYLRRYCFGEVPMEGEDAAALPVARGSTIFADLAESFQHLHALDLELRRPDGTRVPVADITIIDARRLLDLSLLREEVEEELSAAHAMLDDDANRADDELPWERDDGMFTTAMFEDLGLDDPDDLGLDDPDGVDDPDDLRVDGGLCLAELEADGPGSWEERGIVSPLDRLMAPEVESLIGRFQIQVMLDDDDAIP